jgi:hypothetical protein
VDFYKAMTIQERGKKNAPNGFLIALGHIVWASFQKSSLILSKGSALWGKLSHLFSIKGHRICQTNRWIALKRGSHTKRPGLP